MSCVRVERAVIAVALLATAPLDLQAQARAQAQAAGAAAWPATASNPVPLADDVVLPMPCGGAMTFRRVFVPSADALDDRRVQLGNANGNYAYTENTRTEYIAAGFTDPKAKNQRYYLIGKYEVTQLQFDALSGSCPAVNERARMPKVGMTWIEAASFAARYGDWLAKNAAAKLPAEQGGLGFVRMPTEAEWEFAARGGIAVQPDVFDQPTPPMPEGMSKYVWFSGTESSNNELNSIGLLKANPIGLHDMLGNAGEFVLDPFRLNKHSHMHGQAGGYVIKGGDFMTAQAAIRSAARIEYVPIDKNGERRDKSTGVRLAIVAASLPSPQSAGMVRERWSALAQSGSTGPVSTDPAKEIDALAQAATDPAMKSRIEGVGSMLKASIQARNEQRDRAAKSQLQVVAYIARKIIQDDRYNQALARMSSAKEDHERGLAAIDESLRYLMELLKQLGQDYPSQVTAAQAEILKREFEARKLPNYAAPIDLGVRYADRIRNGQVPDRKAVLDDVIKLGSR